MLYNVILLLFLSKQTTQLTIYTALGVVEGTLYHVGPHNVYGFKDIPFAEKPFEQLRFQLPVKIEREYIVKSSLETSEHICAQPVFRHNRLVSHRFQGNEDCLYLDIYVRQENNLENSSLPVVVYFHGGGFIRGSKEEYGPDFLLRFSNIILVIPNYRLGILGFLNNRDSTIPGNMGLWDQRLALQWVVDNIDRFGGDAKRITIAGHEAGGMSVGLHILSQASHDYFQNAISVSGCALTPSLFDARSSATTALTVIHALNCSSMASQILLCLQTVNLQHVMKVQANMSWDSFLPSVDIAAREPFVPMHPKIMYQKGCHKNVNYLVGYAENEIALEVSREFPKTLKHQHLDKMIGHFLETYFGELPNYNAILTAVKYHYLKGVFIPTFESIEPTIVSILTDFLYKSPTEQLMDLHGRKNAFMYVFQKGLKTTCGSRRRHCYGDEFYLFNHTQPAATISQNPTEAEMYEMFCGAWENFTKYGHPDPQGPWKAFGDSRNYAVVSDTIQPKISKDREATEFWSGLVFELTTAENGTDFVSPLFHHDSNYSTIGSWGAAGLAILCSVLCVALISLVIITKRRNLAMSIVPESSPKDVKFSRVDECI